MKHICKNTTAVIAALIASAIAVPAFAAGVATSPAAPVAPTNNPAAVAVTTVNPVVPSEAPVEMASPVQPSPAPVPPVPAKSGSSENGGEDDPGAAEAIKVAKRFFGPTDAYDKVETYSSKQGSLTVYEISWTQGKDVPDMYASVGSDGVVYSWNLSKNISYGKIVTPSVTKLQAATKGLELIKRLYPDIAGDFSVERANVSYSIYGTFSAEYLRIHDGYPVEDEYILVSLDKDGELKMSKKRSRPSRVAPAEQPRLPEAY